MTFVPGAVTISAVEGYDAAMTGSVKRLSAETSGDVYAKDEAALKRIVSASGGSYGKALAILEGKNKKTPQLIKKAEYIVSLLSEKDGAHLMLALIDESGDRETYASILSLAENALRDLAMVKKGGESDMIFYSDRALALELSGRFSISTLVRLTSVLDNLYFEVTQTNINVRTAAVVASGRLTDVM